MIPSARQYFLTLLPFLLLSFWLLEWQLTSLVSGLLFMGFFYVSFRVWIVKGIHQVMTVIGRIQVAILMVIIYTLILLPSAMIYQWRHRDKQKGENTAFRDRIHLYQLSDFEHPW